MKRCSFWIALAVISTLSLISRAAADDLSPSAPGNSLPPPPSATVSSSPTAENSSIPFRLGAASPPAPVETVAPFSPSAQSTPSESRVDNASPQLASLTSFLQPTVIAAPDQPSVETVALSKSVTWGFVLLGFGVLLMITVRRNRARFDFDQFD